MANSKPKNLDLDDENAERAKYAGRSLAEIEAAASAIRSHKQKSSELSGTLSGKLGVFEDKGGHKAALKVAERVASMEPNECADWMRSFLGYFDALGGNKQIDMFDQINERDANEASIAVASKVVEVSEPRIGAEPTAH